MQFVNYFDKLHKTRINLGERAELYFWRDSNGNEVDVIADAGVSLTPIEIKAGQTINRDFFTSLERWMALAGDRAAAPSLVYGGTERHVRKGVRVFGWQEADQSLVER